MSILVFDPKHQFIIQKKQILDAVNRVLVSGNYILGNEVLKFEKSFSKLHNAKYGIGVKNGTDALLICLKALNIQSGDEVITTSHTALATISAIISVGATPVIIDIEKDFYTLDPKMIEKYISKKTKAILPVHIYGQCCDMHKIIKIAKKNKIAVIEDCSQAHGAKIKNRPVGTFGDLSTFSFYPTKNVSALGDGGIILTNKRTLERKIRRYRQYGWDNNRNTNHPGINSRLDEVQAAILNIKLKNFLKYKKKRIDIAKTYLMKIKNKNITLPKIRNQTTHAFHIFAVIVKNRQKFIKYLNHNGVYPGIHYTKLAHENIGYTEYCKFRMKDLIHCSKIKLNEVSLPIYPELSKEKINKIIKIINNFI